MDVLFIRRQKLLNLLRIVHNVSRRSAVDLVYKIHGQSPGEGTPIIVLHGLLGSKKNWQSMCKRINSATQRTVIAADLRNHGESPHSNSHTYMDLASDVSQLLDKLTISKAAVIGHSMGGRTGMVLALTEPEKVTSLLVVDISPVSTAGVLNDFFPRLIDVMKTVNLQGAKSAFDARSVVKDKILASGLISDENSMHFVIMNIGVKPDKTVGWMCNLDALKEFFPTIASFPAEMTGKTYTGPTLFIGGDQSNYIPPEDLPGIKEYFPQVELTYVKGVGHNVHTEDPNTFFNLAIQFLSKK